MLLVSPFLTILVLNVNRLRSPIQRIGLLNGLKKIKQEPAIYHLQETHFCFKET